jgi:integrase
MADHHATPRRPASAPRRTRIESNIYKRPDGALELGYRDSEGRQRWQALGHVGIKTARAERDSILGARGKGTRVVPSPRLRFGEATERWLTGPVAELRPSTQAAYRHAVAHALKRWQRRRLDAIEPGQCVQLVRELRAEGLSESYIGSVLGCAHQVFRFARRHLRWQGASPVADLLRSERPSTTAAERRVYVGDELAQTIAASHEPWTTLFRLAAVVGARESELLGLHWDDLGLADLDAATIRFTHQVDRRGGRVPLKTDESKATLPLPRSTAVMLLEHRARSANAGPRAFVFATRSGRPLGQRNVLRALHRAQELARDPQGQPTFPDLFEHDTRGNLTVDDEGRYVLRRTPRRQLPPLPDFHAIRHAAAMDCDDAEEARDLLRHRNSTVTRAVYRAHFSDRRRESLRARMEARLEAANGNGPQQTPDPPGGEVVRLQDVRDAAQ